MGPGGEGPTDLRLVPPAAAAWATAAITVGTSTAWAAVVGAVALAAAVLLAAVSLLRRRARSESAEHRPGHLSPAPRRAPNLRTATVVAVLLGTAAAGASAALHRAEVEQGPLPDLASRYATVTAELEVVADPRRSRPRTPGPGALPPSVLVEAEVTRLTGPDGSVTATRTPVLVVVRGEPTAADSPAAARKAPSTAPDAQAAAPHARSSPSWTDLLPSTRLRVRAGTAPPFTGSERSAAVLRVSGEEPPIVVGEPSGVQRLAGRLRAGLKEATDGLPADARALLPGLVVGDTSRLPPDLDAAFRATDLTHLLAVSGSNLTIVLVLLIGPPGLAMRAERRGIAARVGLSLRTTALLGGALTIGFVIVCRPDPSVVRAAACGAVVLLAIATGRRRALLPALAAVVLVLVLYDPWLSRSYGFLLSVLATGALLTLAPRWAAALRRRGVPARLAEALAAATAAQAVCAPVVAVLAARVSLVAVPCNLLAELAVAPATVLGFAALAAAPLVMPVAKGLAWCASWPVGWIAEVARTGAALPGAEVDWPGGWRGGLLLAVGTVLVLWVGRRLLRHPALVLVCVLLLALTVVRPPPLSRIIAGWPPPGWRFVMCDVGQGDATVLRAGTGTAVVVDAGPDPLLVDRCLRTLGITRIPMVLLTHFHADHVAGLPGVLRGREVGVIQTTGLREPAGQAAFVRRRAAEFRVPVSEAVAGERRRTGELSWEVLWTGSGLGTPHDHVDAVGSGGDVPGGSGSATSDASGGGSDGESGSGANDASVTLLARIAGVTLFLPGDLEPPAQRALLRSQPGLPRADVLKVAHHGSAHQDPGLLARVSPRLALISCGADNSYGHPAPRTLSVLRESGAAVLRTDRDGAVAVTGEGDELQALHEGSGAAGEVQRS
ncbi:ComEC family competence protein [Streptomyces sp. YIM 130001]|uniref:ComEC/Rec2 family competence protein n=1 Tax=Streptomyces sp. YIM 130001 TaxID=2259644 RepID=UPI000E64C7A6|nr:ComEC/Rec2 family competence protein [Streptomyces sp. YIM 130001]RII08722.1 ComEC family competence protein [Streptomyces sp. YIM 130001]